MKADSIIALILIFSVITIAIGGIVGDMKSSYALNVSTTWENKYNFANEINESVSGIAKDTQAAGKESGWLSVLSGASAVFQATVTTVSLIWKVPGYTLSMIRGVASEMGMPPIVSNVIIPIFIVMILIAFAFIVIRFVRGENV
jgi:hypothetical protein